MKEGKHYRNVGKNYLVTNNLFIFLYNLNCFITYCRG